MKNFIHAKAINFLTIALLSVFLLVAGLPKVNAQCAYGGTSYCGGAANTFTFNTWYGCTCFYGGEYMLVTGVMEGDYLGFASCTPTANAYDNQLTLFREGDGTARAYNDDNGPFCASNNASILYKAAGSNAGGVSGANAANGQWRVLNNVYNCATNATCGNLYVMKYPIGVAAETNPTFTAASGCSNGTARMGAGAYYDIAVTANTYYNWTWNNNGSAQQNGFYLQPLNGNGAAVGQNTSTTAWYSGTTTSVRIHAWRIASLWSGTSGILTYRHTQPTSSPSVSTTSGCAPLVINLTGAGSYVTTSWAWSGGPPGSYTTGSAASQSPTFTATAGTGAFTLTTSNNGCTTSTATSSITAYSTTNNVGTITAPSVVCPGATFTVSNSTAATTGSPAPSGPTYNFYLQKTDAPNLAGWASVSGGLQGASSWTYTMPNAPGTYQVARNSANGCASEASAPFLTITVPNNFAAGAVLADQTVCNATGPSAFTSVSAALGGNGSYTYTWQSSPDNSTFTDIAGANSATYTPPNTVGTIYYRRKVSETSGCFTSPITTGAAQNIAWTNTATGNSIVNGTTLTKTTGTNGGWDGGASGLQAVVKGGYVEFKPLETTGYKMMGLNSDPLTDQSYASIDYALYLQAGAAISVYENGGNPFNGGTYTTSDVFRVEWTSGNQIVYKKNGTVFYTSTVTPSATLYPDCSIYYYSSGFSNVTVQGDDNNTVLVRPALAPTITAGSTICYNTGVTLTATGVGGGGSYTYLWYKNGVSTGTTTNTLATGNLTATSTYYCAVTDASCGLANTSSSTITVRAQMLPTITAGSTICYNTGVTLTAAGVGGGGSYTYLWYKNGVSTGTTTNTLATGNLTATSTYYCEVTDATCGLATTSSSTITVRAQMLPTITAGSTICYNTGVTLTATGVGGGGSYTYLWYKNGVSTGTTTNTLATGNLTATSTYYCEVTDATCGLATTSSSTITVRAQMLPTITAGSTICYNTGVTLTATGVGGGGSYTYLWYKNGVSTGTTTNTLATGNLTATSTYYCEVTDATCGLATTSSSTITVRAQMLPTITAGSTICYNTGVTLTATGVGGGGSYTYLWYKNGVSTGTTTNTLATGNLTATSTYYCEVTDATCGLATTSSSTITVRAQMLPTITAGSTICYNTGVTLTATGVGGGGSYTYLWYKNGVSTGTTTNTLATGNLTATSTYYCAVTDATCGLVNTSSSTITVRAQMLPTITAGSTICYNTGVTLTATGVGGGGSYTYLWYKNGVSTGTTTNTLATGNLTATSTYYCEVTDATCGLATTSSSTITVSGQTVAPTLNVATPGSNGQIYVQNFDATLSSTSSVTWTDNSTIPGWYAASTNLGANGLVIGTGSSNIGNLNNYGSSSATDRTIGSLASASTGTLRYGVKLTNSTGASIDKIYVQYTGEQWRAGGGAAVANLLTLDYSTDPAATITTGTYNTTSGLSFTSPITPGTAGALDGNAGANRSTITGIISLGSSLANGSSVWLRWTDLDESNSDHGLGVDDLTVILYTSTGTTICAGYNGPNATITAGSGGSAGAADTYEKSIDNGLNWSSYTSGATIDATGATGSVQVRGTRSGGGLGCIAAGPNVLAHWPINTPTVNPTLNTATPASGTGICEGYNGPNATITAGSGGSTGATDTYEKSIDNGSTWSAYTSGATIDATGATGSVQVRVSRSAGSYGCTATGPTVIATWPINSTTVNPTLNVATPASTTGICAGYNGPNATITAGSGGSAGAADTYEKSIDNGSTWSAYTSGATIDATGATGSVQVRASRSAGSYGCTATGPTVIATWPINAATVNPTLNTATPASGTGICAGYNGPNATITAGSGGSAGAADSYEFSIDNGGSWSAYSSGATIDATGATGSVKVRVSRSAGSYGCTATGPTVIATWTINAPTVNPTLNTATPANGTGICAGYNGPNATIVAGTGGNDGAADTYEFSIDNGGSWSAYTPGATIDATGATGSVKVRGSRSSGSYGCSGTGPTVLASWPINSATVNPTLNAATPSNGTTICQGATPNATITAGTGGSAGAADTYEYSIDNGTSWSAYTSGASITTTTATGSVKVRTSRSAGSYGCVATGPTVIASWPVDELPIPDAGPDQIICGAQTTVLAGNTAPGGGSGVWTYDPGNPSGTAFITANNPTATALASAYGAHIYYWTLSYGVCPDQTDAVTIYYSAPIVANAVVDDCAFTGTDKDIVLVTATGGTGTLTYTSSNVLDLQLTGIDNNTQPFEAPTDGLSRNYTVTDIGGCFSTTSNVTTYSNHQTDIPYSTSAGTADADCYSKQLNRWLTFRDSNNDAIMSIKDNNQNLGLVTVHLYRESVEPQILNSSQNAHPYGNGNCYLYPEHAMERHFAVTTQNTFTNPVDVRLYFSDVELADLIGASTAPPSNPSDGCADDDDVHNISELYVTKYDGNNVDGDYTNNSSETAGGFYRMFGANVTLPNTPFDEPNGNFSALYSGGTAHHYLQMHVTEFSEFWLHGSSNIEPLPVDMIYFEANAMNNTYIQLKWATSLEINNDGFNVERSVDGQTWTLLAFVDGHDNSTVQNDYTYNDVNVVAGTRYYYRLKQVDNDGQFKYTDVVTAIINGEITFSVKDFVPNPTIAATSLIITAVSEQQINVDFYNVIGEKVSSSIHQLNKGGNLIEFDLRRFASGTYTAVVSSANEVYTKKLVITK